MQIQIILQMCKLCSPFIPTVVSNDSVSISEGPFCLSGLSSGDYGIQTQYEADFSIIMINMMFWLLSLLSTFNPFSVL